MCATLILTLVKVNKRCLWNSVSSWLFCLWLFCWPYLHIYDQAYIQPVEQTAVFLCLEAFESAPRTALWPQASIQHVPPCCCMLSSLHWFCFFFFLPCSEVSGLTLSAHRFCQSYNAENIWKPNHSWPACLSQVLICFPIVQTHPVHWLIHHSPYSSHLFWLLLPPYALFIVWLLWKSKKVFHVLSPFYYTVL